MRIPNKRIVNRDPEVLAMLRSEYAMLGFDTSPITDGGFIVYSKRQRRPKSKKRAKGRN